MIKKSASKIPLLAADGEPVLAIIPAKTVIIFPGETVSLQVGRPSNIALIEDSAGKDDLIGVVYSPRGNVAAEDIDLCQVGMAVRLVSWKDGPGDSKIVSLEGVRRIALLEIDRTTPYLTARIGFVEQKIESTEKTNCLCREIIEIIEQITRINPDYSDELSYVIRLNLQDPGKFADKVATAFHLPISARQEVLETIHADRRLRKILKLLRAELQRITITQEIKVNIEERNTEEQRRFYLQQQLYEIKRQLGDEFIEDKVSQQMKSDIRRARMLPPEVRERAIIEAERLGRLSSASAEFAATKVYLDWLMGIPYKVCKQAGRGIKQIEADIDRDYYGSQQIKDRIMEWLVLRQLSGGVDQGPVLCLAGAPGTGKASLCRAIARGLRTKFARLSVGGLVDLSDIKGSSRTFLGAGPGIFIRTLKDTGVCDPVILIEDIEYFADDANTALPLALLEAIDPRYNRHFLDNYINIPIDLSQVLFICSVSSVDEIPEMFNHRFEFLELSGYIEREKLHIARKHIIPKALKKHNLRRSELGFTVKGLEKIIRYYTQEAGLLTFSRLIDRICRHTAREKTRSAGKTYRVNDRTVEEFLGTPVYVPEMPDKKPEIGVAVGLAWTGMGGDLMIIEGLKMKGSGEVITTGSLGDVMKESIQAAHSYVRSKADMLGIDHADFDDLDIHIHFPSGAIPKDGPSAGVTVSLVIASLMAERPIRNDIAMTGEVTLRGKVLTVGGIKEKISAAYRAGIRKIFIPKENRKDLKDLPPDIIKKTKFYFIEIVDQLFEQALLNFVPSSYTLEKIFAEEMKKAKSRKKQISPRKVAAKSKK